MADSVAAYWCPKCGQPRQISDTGRCIQCAQTIRFDAAANAASTMPVMGGPPGGPKKPVPFPPGQAKQGTAWSGNTPDVKQSGGGCLGLVLAVVLIGGLASTCGGGGSDVGGGNAYGAQSACEDWVKDQLKAPSTADFSDVDISGGDPWTITGTVDAENGFGAQIRATWTCDVRLEGDYYRGSATVLE